MFSQHAQDSGSVSITVDCWTGVPIKSSGISAILGVLDSIRRVFPMRALGLCYFHQSCAKIHARGRR